MNFFQKIGDAYKMEYSENATRPMVFTKGADFVLRIEPYVSMMRRYDIFMNGSHKFMYEANLTNLEGFNGRTSMAVPNYVQVKK